MRHFTVKEDTNIGYTLKNLEFYASKIEPPKTPIPVQSSKYVLCAKFQYFFTDYEALQGVTCDKWVVGRYGIVQNMRDDHLNNILQLAEVAVYGFKIKDFKF